MIRAMEETSTIAPQPTTPETTPDTTPTSQAPRTPPIDDRGLVEISQKREQDIAKKKIRFGKWMIVVKAILVAIIIFSGVVFYNYQRTKVAPPAFTVTQKPPEQVVVIDPNKSTDTSTWTLYRNPKVRVFISHPDDASVIETDNPALRVDVVYDKNNVLPTSATEKSLSEGYIFRVTPLDVVVREIDEVTATKMESYKITCPKTATFSKPKKSLVDGLDARTFEILNCDGDYIISYVQKFGIYLEVVELYKGDFGYKQKYRAILEEIMRAFRLFPEYEAPVGPYKSFIDEKNKISFKHPNLDETCCETPAPPVKPVGVVVQLGDKTTFKDANNFDGVGVFVGGDGYKSIGFEATLATQKKLLIEDFKVVKGFDPTTQDIPVKVGKFDGVMLKGYSWRGNDLVYVQITNKNGPKLVVFSIKNITGEEFQNKVMDILSSFETF